MVEQLPCKQQVAGSSPIVSLMQRERAMIDFIVDVAAVVVGIAVYKYVDEWRQDLIWRWKQRHESSPDPWDNW